MFVMIAIFLNELSYDQLSVADLKRLSAQQLNSPQAEM